MQYCRFGRIRCRRPAAAGSAGHADRPSGKTSGLHCRHGGVLRRPSSWSAVHNTGAQRPFDVTEVCAATIPVVGKGTCKHCARSDATAITRTADRPGDADLVVRALALLEGLCRITRRRLSNRRPPVEEIAPTCVDSFPDSIVRRVKLDQLAFRECWATKASTISRILSC